MFEKDFDYKVARDAAQELEKKMKKLGFKIKHLALSPRYIRIEFIHPELGVKHDIERECQLCHETFKAPRYKNSLTENFCNLCCRSYDAAIFDWDKARVEKKEAEEEIKQMRKDFPDYTKEQELK